MSDPSEEQSATSAGEALGSGTSEELSGASHAGPARLVRMYQDQITERWERRPRSAGSIRAGGLAGPSGLPGVLADVIEGADPALLAREAAEGWDKPATLADVLVELEALEWATLQTLAQESGGLAAELVEIVSAPVHAAQNIAVGDEVARLTAASLEDPLTGLGNRRALGENLIRDVAQTSRQSQPLTVVVVDVDNLKAINDRSGHAAGDQTLVDLARAVRDCLRASDTAFRFGGDEFALLLPGTALAGVSHLIGRIMAAGAPSFSWGAACSPDDGVNGDDLLAVADRRLYEHRRLVR